MAISASAVTRFGIAGGMWSPVGDFSTKEPGDTYTVAPPLRVVFTATETRTVATSAENRTVITAQENRNGTV